MPTPSPAAGSDSDTLSPEQMARFQALLEKLSVYGNPFEHEHTDACGEGCGHDHAPEPDYLAELGLGESDAPLLLDIAGDWLDQEFPPDFPAWVFAPVHAWRALGQLKAPGHAQEVIEGLLDLYIELLADDDDAGQELPFVVAQFGDAAFSPLLQAAKELGPELPLLDSLYSLSQGKPDRQKKLVDVLGLLINEQDDNEPQGNAALAVLLGELDTAKAHARAIERAYAADRVDETIAGDWGTLRATYDLPSAGLAQDGRRAHWWRDAVGESLYERELVRQREKLNQRDKAKEDKEKEQAKPKSYKKRK